MINMKKTEGIRRNNSGDLIYPGERKWGGVKLGLTLVCVGV